MPQKNIHSLPLAICLRSPLWATSEGSVRYSPERCVDAHPPRASAASKKRLFHRMWATPFLAGTREALAKVEWRAPEDVTEARACFDSAREDRGDLRPGAFAGRDELIDLAEPDGFDRDVQPVQRRLATEHAERDEGVHGVLDRAAEVGRRAAERVVDPGVRASDLPEPHEPPEHGPERTARRVGIEREVVVRSELVLGRLGRRLDAALAPALEHAERLERAAEDRPRRLPEGPRAEGPRHRERREPQGGGRLLDAQAVAVRRDRKRRRRRKLARRRQLERRPTCRIGQGSDDGREPRGGGELERRPRLVERERPELVPLAEAREWRRAADREEPEERGRDDRLLRLLALARHGRDLRHGGVSQESERALERALEVGLGGDRHDDDHRLGHEGPDDGDGDLDALLPRRRQHGLEPFVRVLERPPDRPELEARPVAVALGEVVLGARHRALGEVRALARLLELALGGPEQRARLLVLAARAREVGLARGTLGGPTRPEVGDLAREVRVEERRDARPDDGLRLLRRRRDGGRDRRRRRRNRGRHGRCRLSRRFVLVLVLALVPRRVVEPGPRLARRRLEERGVGPLEALEERVELLARPDLLAHPLGGERAHEREPGVPGMRRLDPRRGARDAERRLGLSPVEEREPERDGALERERPRELRHERGYVVGERLDEPRPEASAVERRVALREQPESEIARPGRRRARLEDAREDGELEPRVVAGRLPRPLGLLEQGQMGPEGLLADQVEELRRVEGVELLGPPDAPQDRPQGRPRVLGLARLLAALLVLLARAAGARVVAADLRCLSPDGLLGRESDDALVIAGEELVEPLDERAGPGARPHVATLAERRERDAGFAASACA